MSAPILDAYLQGLVEEIASRVAEKLRGEMPAAQTDPLRKIEEVARQLGISDRSARDMVNGRDGQPPKLASLKVGPSEGSRVVRQSEIDRYVVQQEQAG